MEKQDMRTGIVIVLLLIAFQVVAFAIPFAHTAAFWLAYAFTMLAMLAQYPLMRLAFRGRRSIYGFPIARMAWLYLAAQSVFGLAAMILAPWIPYWLVLLVSVLLLVAAAVGSIATTAAREEVELADTRINANSSTMRELQSQALSLAKRATDPREAALVRALAEEFRYSDPVSSAETAPLEDRLATCLVQLDTALQRGTPVSDLCSQARAFLEERNRLCKTHKSHT